MFALCVGCTIVPLLEYQRDGGVAVVSVHNLLGITILVQRPLDLLAASLCVYCVCFVCLVWL